MKGFGKQKGDVGLAFIMLIIVILVGAIVWGIIQDSNTPSYTKGVTQSYSVEGELKGCTVHYLRSNTEKDLYVVRCPSTTTSQWEESNGKTTTEYSTTSDNY